MTEIQTATEWSVSPERLAISLDDDGDRSYAMILYVPNINHHEHFHITLTDKGLRDLHDATGKMMAAKGIGSSVLKQFFAEIEHGDLKHRQWLAEKFKEFWGVEVKPRFDGDIPE